jgi:2-amino-4-hydroxy-6-hydroxymethyldihydropteridine diphosphokinase
MEPLPVPLWRPAYVAIGSNLDDPRLRVGDAFERLAALRATALLLRSRLYLSRPMGPQDQPDYVNAVAGLLTRLTARELLAELLELERAAGRERRQRWGPRVLDLDLVSMGGLTIDEPGLTLPHPGVPLRNFVLYPLSDIAPTLTIPGHGRVADLKSRVGGDGLAILQ